MSERGWDDIRARFRKLEAENAALRDELTDRANVEADLRAQLAETKADPPPSFGFRETDGSVHSDGR